MRIQSVRVCGFRSIYDATMECDQLTALVGANGAGKSTLLRALAVFYNPTAAIEDTDFYNISIGDSIHITVQYIDLRSVEHAAFEPYVHNDILTVEKRIVWEAERKRACQEYYSLVKQHTAFAPLRSANTSFNDRRKLYNDHREQPTYTSLPIPVASDAALRSALATWEQAHPDQCTLQSSLVAFFGSKATGVARLDLYTRFLLIEAQRDAHASALDERDTPVKQLLDEVVRNVLAENESVQQLQRQAADALNAVSNHLDLERLRNQLNATMHQFAPNTSIRLNWQKPMLSLPIPRVDLMLSEDGYDSPINRTGHGVQRAFMITLLQHLAMSAQRTATEHEVVAPDPETAFGQAILDQQTIAAVTQPNLVLAIEEPELYQHPTRQRHFATILRDLAHGSIKGVADSLQVLYCTHSPYFVSIDRFEQIRVIAKSAGLTEDSPKCTGVRSTTRSALSKLTEAQLALMMNSNVNEGFFARVVVLVEGEGDRAFLQGVARHHQLPLEANGVTIVSVEGKGNLSKPLLVFRALGISVYPIWDNDCDKIDGDRQGSIRLNREILRQIGQPETDWPLGTHATHAIFAPKLEKHLESEIVASGIDWTQVEQEAHNIGGSKPWKKHATVAHVVQYATKHGCTFPATRAMLDHICVIAGIGISDETQPIQV